MTAEPPRWRALAPWLIGVAIALSLGGATEWALVRARLEAADAAARQAVIELDDRAELAELLDRTLEREQERTASRPATDPTLVRRAAERRRELAAALADAHREDRRRTVVQFARGRNTTVWFASLVGALAGVVCALWMFHRRHRVTLPLGALRDTLTPRADGSRGRWQPAGAAAIRDLGRACAQTLDDLEGARRDLGARVDRQTVALSSALEEQRGLNAALESARCELEAAQDRLIQKEKLAALGTVSAGVAHEFNNILGGIGGLARELSSDPITPVAHCAALQAMDRAAERGRRIVEGLRIYSRGARAERLPCRVNDAMAEVQRLLSPEAQAREVLLSVAMPASSPLVMATPGDLEQILMNLVRNAIQSSPARSTVELCSELRLERVVLSVHDRGSGVSSVALPRLFEPFFTTRPREGGTGLGLAIAHGLSRSLQGELRYEPRTGGGATFTCDFPSALFEGKLSS